MKKYLRTIYKVIIYAQVLGSIALIVAYTVLVTLMQAHLSLYEICWLAVIVGGNFLTAAIAMRFLPSAHMDGEVADHDRRRAICRCCRDYDADQDMCRDVSGKSIDCPYVQYMLGGAGK